MGPTSGADGFDGKLVWSQDSFGEPRPEGAENARQGAADEAYRTAVAYWFPQRWLAQIEQFRSQPPGTKLRLAIQSGEQKRDVVLVLKNLV